MDDAAYRGKILFVLPRYHTNLHQSVNDLLSAGYRVTMLVQHVGPLENHENVKPVRLKESLLWKVVEKYLKKSRGENYAESKKITWFIPSLTHLWSVLRRERPDIVIVRDRNVSALLTTLCSRLLGIKRILLYNQSPVYRRTPEGFWKKFKAALKNAAIRALFPRERITPVEFATYDDYLLYREHPEKFTEDPNVRFVPLSVPTNDEVLKRNYCKDGVIKVLDVGKYREYKNHFVVVDAIDSLLRSKDPNFPIRVTIVGQALNSEEKAYYEKLQSYIAQKGLDNRFTLVKNVPPTKMSEIYLGHDVFVLPSKREIFGYALLEAMMHGLLVVSTSANGSATYVGDAGYIFKSGDHQHLAEILANLDQELIREKGLRAYERIKSVAGPGSFLKAINPPKYSEPMRNVGEQT